MSSVAVANANHGAGRLESPRASGGAPDGRVDRVAVRERACWCGRFRRRPTSFRPARWRRRFWAGTASSSARAAMRSSWSASRTRDRPVKRSARIAASEGLMTGPSIECGGDRVLVEKFLYRISPAEAVGSGRVPFSRRALAGLRQTRRRPSRRVDSDQATATSL